MSIHKFLPMFGIFHHFPHGLNVIGDGDSQGSRFSAANFSKFRGPVCQIPWLTDWQIFQV